MSSTSGVSSVGADEAGAAGDRDRVAWRGSVQRREVGEVGLECVVGLAGDVAFEAADDLALGLAFGGAPRGVGAGAWAVAQAADGGHVQAAVGVAVAAVVEAVTDGASGGRWDRAGAAECRERAVAAEAVDVLAGGDEQLPGVPGRDAQQLRGAWSGPRDERLELGVELGDLGVEDVDALGECRVDAVAAWCV